MATSFATSILPLFRPSDIQCMAARGVKLDDAAWMRDPAGRLGFPDHANARRVYSKLSSGDMPPDGAWPQDRLDVFNQWMSEGFNA